MCSFCFINIYACIEAGHPATGQRRCTNFIAACNVDALPYNKKDLLKVIEKYINICRDL